MTTHERMKRMYEHREADRIPIMDAPWGATIERWHREGLPEGVDFTDFFELDHLPTIAADTSPRYPQKVIEETDEYKIYTSSWGVTMKQWKHMASTPEFLDFTIVDPDSWRQAKARMTPDRDRIRWDDLKKNHAGWRRKGYWIKGGLWFGFDVTHSWMVGTERVLVALVEKPEWCKEMFAHQLETGLSLLDQIWEAGYTFDEIYWPDDMGYKHSQFFSVGCYREILKPFHKRAIDWAHAKGIKARLHSCGDVNPFVPELLELGLDALNPLEVKAGMDPVALKRAYGDRLVLHGGLDALLWDKPDAIMAEMSRVIPLLKANGGYICSSDHSVPSSVSLQDFRRIVEQAKMLGRY